MAICFISGGNRRSEFTHTPPVGRVTVPVPNTEAAEDWWFVQAEEDLDRVLAMLAQLEKVGVPWVHGLLDKIAENV